jgi:MFS family permease
MAIAPSLPVALIGAAVAGAGNSVEWVAARTAVQERTPDRWMAMVMGLTESMSQLAPGLGIVLGGLITALTMSRVAFAVAAGGSLVFAAAVPIVFRRPVAAPPDAAPVVDEAPDLAARQRGKSLV